MSDKNSRIPEMINQMHIAQDYSKISHIINSTKTTTTTIVITTQETTLTVIAITTITKITSTTSIRRGPQGRHSLGAACPEADGS